MTEFYVNPNWVAYEPTLMGRLRCRYYFWKLGRQPLFHFSCRKVGGLRFVKLGRLTFSFCVSKTYRPL